MAMSAGGGGSVKAEPNVTPMIDVMLVLLIIFMIVIPALMSGFNAQPPQGVNIKQHPPEDADQVLGIDANGQYYLNKQPIRNESLAQAVKSIYDVRTIDKIMYVQADKGLAYSKIVDAIDILSHNGVRMTGMISEQLPGTSSSISTDVAQATGGKK